MHTFGGAPAYPPENPTYLWSKLGRLSSHQRRALFKLKFGRTGPRQNELCKLLKERYCPEVYRACEVCGKHTEQLEFAGFRRYCSFRCAKKHLTLRNRDWCVKQGVDNPSQLERVKSKKREKALQTYGVPNPMQAKEVQENQRNTVYQRYGVYNPSQSKEILQRKKATWLAKYGVDNPWKSERIKRKIRRVFKEKYGRHPMQTEEGFRKAFVARFQYKTKVICGKVFTFMGGEGKVIERLLQKGFQVTTEVDSIAYFYKRKERRYFPDLIAEKEGRRYLIEVKSTFTLGLNHYPSYRRNRKKFHAASLAEYHGFILMLVHKTGISPIFNPETLTLRALRRLLKQKGISW